jgi:hypothetical protein
MANNRFNMQVTPKGYKAGGQVKNSKGTSTSTKGNIRHGKLKSQKELKTITDSKKYKDASYGDKTKMLNVATMKKGGKVRGDIKLGRALVEAFGSKKTINKMKSNIQDQNRVKKMDGGRAKGLIPEAQEKAKSMTVKSSKRRVKKMGGGSLKAVPADNKGLKKLPTEVRNKMGFMKKGGKVYGK